MGFGRKKWWGFKWKKMVHLDKKMVNLDGKMVGFCWKNGGDLMLEWWSFDERGGLLHSMVSNIFY